MRLSRKPGVPRRNGGGTMIRVVVSLAALLSIGGWLMTRGSPSDRPDEAGRSLTIISPVAGKVIGTPVRVHIGLVGSTLGQPSNGLDHLHVSIDGSPPQAVYANPDFTISMEPGKHSLAVELAGPDHLPLLPPQAVSFIVGN